MISESKNCRIVVLISGNGSNLQAIIDYAKKNRSFTLSAVISNQSQAYGLIRAENAGIPTAVVCHKDYENTAAFEDALVTTILGFQPDLIVLAGFMRILSEQFVLPFSGKILNIHPALLPKFKGLNTHQRVLDAAETEHGLSIHFVTAELDSGPIVCQLKVPVLKNDKAQDLAERVLQVEHWIYPQVIDWFAQKRLKNIGNIVTLDEAILAPQGLQLLSPTAGGLHG